MNPLEKALQFIQQAFQPKQVHSFRKPGFENVGQDPMTAQAQQVAQPTQAPQQMPTDMPTPQATPISIPQERLAQNISSTWGKNTPLLENLQLYMDAGNKLPGNMEKLLPIALALRETQGGKDLQNPAAMKGPNDGLGDNNVFNIRNDQSQFQNYPDLETAVMGNLEKGGQSGGVVGLLGGTKPSSKHIYEDFRKSNDYKDLFKRWSPTEDRNGSMEEQIRNIEFILSKLKQ